MKIKQLEVDRFRIWRDLTLPVNETGLSVFYGPNEAGKSTLMRFVRAVLYGFDASDIADIPRGEARIPWSGSMRVSHRGESFRLKRRSNGKTGGKLKISGHLDGRKVSDIRKMLIGDTDRDVYEDLFAFGLKELQQLATMDSRDVAERIYGLSLGPKGRSLLEAINDIAARRRELTGETGRLPALFGDYQRLAVAARTPEKSRERHSQLCGEREELDEKLKSLRKRQQTLQSNQRGHEYLHRCWKPWKRVRDLSAELEALPYVGDLSKEEVFEALNRLEKDISAAEKARDTLLAEAAQLRQQLDRRGGDSTFAKRSPAIRSLVEQADWLREIDTHLHSGTDSLSAARVELKQAVESLGENWSVERLEAIDNSPDANIRLLQTARRYSSAMSRRSRLRALNRKLSKSSQQQLVELNGQLEELRGQPIESLIDAEQTRLTDLESLGSLRMRDFQLRHHGTTVNRLLEKLDVNNSLPPWVDWVFGFFGVAGVLLFCLGLLVGMQTGALAGAAFGMCGLMWWGFRTGLQNHFASQTLVRLDDLVDEAESTEKELKAVESQISRVTGGKPVHAFLAEHGGQVEGQEASEALVIRRTVQRIADLERLARQQERVQSRRRRLTTLRQRFRTAQQKVAELRKEWVETLASLGLDETIRIDEGFQQWQQVLEALEVRRRLQARAPETESYKRAWSSMQQRIRKLGQQVPKQKLDYNRPLEVLSAWQQQLQVLDRDEAERDRLKSEEQSKTKESTDYQKLADELHAKYSGILSRAGVASRDDLQQRIEWMELRKSLEEDLALARLELEEVAASEPDMAIVEDDLLSFDAAANAESRGQLTEELDLLSLEVEEKIEQLGSVKQEIKSLESGRRLNAAQQERGRLAGLIHRAAEDWFALQIAERVTNDMRTNFEQNTVSETLEMASEYLSRMTRERYRRIWAPLGKHHVVVDDQLGRSFVVDELSSGTREQLFLAIRLALVREFADQELELPMVMDDLFANFDQSRTEAAVDCLLDFVNSGQQILFFTCHLHLARLFESKGVRPIWLPGPASEQSVPADRSKQSFSEVDDGAWNEAPGTLDDSDALFDDEVDYIDGRRAG